MRHVATWHVACGMRHAARGNVASGMCMGHDDPPISARSPAGRRGDEATIARSPPRLARLADQVVDPRALLRGAPRARARAEEPEGCAADGRPRTGQVGR